MEPKERNLTMIIVSLVSIMVVIGIAVTLMFVGQDRSVSAPTPSQKKTLNFRDNSDVTPSSKALEAPSEGPSEKAPIVKQPVQQYQPPAPQYNAPTEEYYESEDEFYYDDETDFDGDSGAVMDGLGGPEWLDIPDPYNPESYP